MTPPEFSRDATAEGSPSPWASSMRWHPLVASSVDSSAPDVDHPAPDEAIAASAANDGAENASPVDDKAAGEAQVCDVAAARTEPSSSDPSSAAAWCLTKQAPTRMRASRTRVPRLFLPDPHIAAVWALRMTSVVSETPLCRPAKWVRALPPLRRLLRIRGDVGQVLQ